MVRLICDKRMRVGSLLLLAGVASEPMPEAAAQALIASERELLAQRWHAAGILRIIPADQVDAEAAERAFEERLAAAARGAFDALMGAEDPSAAKARLDELWGQSQPATPAAVVSAVDAVVLAMVNAQTMLEALPPEERDDAMSAAEERIRAALSDSDAGGADASGAGGSATENGGEGTGGAPPASIDKLTKLTIPLATPVIAQETDLDRLQGWRDADDRKGIHELIDARLDELTRPPE